MAPAGSYEALQAAINAGADSVYFGVEHLNMRARAANNFTLDDLRKITKICRDKNVKSYLTLNTVVYTDEIELIKTICNSAKEAGITAVIAHDLAVINYANSINLPIHISTQANVSNIEAVKFYSKFADTVVLARELTLPQIKEICTKVKEENIKGPNNELIKIEMFIHGALCVSISGKCYMSLAQYNHSANRGDCLQACRRSYKVTDLETGDELNIDNKYVMSPKDLCTIQFIDKIVDAGVSILKIEGRGRQPDYVNTVTKCYREAVDAYYNKTFSLEKAEEWIAQLETVFNRGFWQGGYYLGHKLGEWANAYGSKAKKEKKFLGTVENYFEKPKVAHFNITTGKIKIGDTIIITGPTTGVLKQKVESIKVNEKDAEEAGKGNDITIPIKDKVRANDKLYLEIDKEKEQKGHDEQ